ncbi:hypothetical protein KTE26_14195 [Ralstonia mannitolilytica]|uniref:hypothetical protein n=1 Tax=Ralstonia mannitolilytica TaxID=105219 RepID=UPI001C238E4F|nr:hypothetical protein [Ralstonia mannitolilytica]MBU9579581.1 hypothetical protein [Ralstonia mannitolilytica]
MCLSNEAAAIKLAERDNLVGELVEALVGCCEHMEWSTSQGRDAYTNAKAAIAKAREGAKS